eukprot:scaffold90928_cov28-Tisochrysis_lutea.AAC.5
MELSGESLLGGYAKAKCVALGGISSVRRVGWSLGMVSSVTLEVVRWAEYFRMRSNCSLCSSFVQSGPSSSILARRGTGGAKGLVSEYQLGLSSSSRVRWVMTFASEATAGARLSGGAAPSSGQQVVMLACSSVRKARNASSSSREKSSRSRAPRSVSRVRTANELDASSTVGVIRRRVRRTQSRTRARNG